MRNKSKHKKVVKGKNVALKKLTSKTCVFTKIFSPRIKKLLYFKTIYPRWKGPTQELYSSSLRTAVVPLFKNYMLIVLVIFLGWVMLLHPQATSTDHGKQNSSFCQNNDKTVILKTIRNSSKLLYDSVFCKHFQ